MSATTKPLAVLVADDDVEGWILTREAMAEADARVEPTFVADGEELLDYLRRAGRYAAAQTVVPDLILLDLNMPRKGGFEVLQDLRADAQLQQIPVVVWSTSQNDADLERAFDLGVNIFVTKPASFDGLVNVLRILGLACFGRESPAAAPAQGDGAGG